MCLVAIDVQRASLICVSPFTDQMNWPLSLGTAVSVLELCDALALCGRFARNDLHLGGRQLSTDAAVGHGPGLEIQAYGIPRGFVLTMSGRPFNVARFRVPMALQA